MGVHKDTQRGGQCLRALSGGAVDALREGDGPFEAVLVGEGFGDGQLAFVKGSDGGFGRVVHFLLRDRRLWLA